MKIQNNADKATDKWRPIEGWENFYSVHADGHIRSDRTGRILKPSPDGGGYMHVNLHACNYSKIKRVHRAVAEEFIPRIEGKNYVNHINSDRSDNRVDNLEWVTQKENIHHAIKAGRRKRSPFQKLTKKQVIQIRRMAREGAPTKLLCRKFGVSGPSIRAIILGKTWREI